MAVRAHLANDHTMFRQGLEAIFATRGDSIEVLRRAAPLRGSHSSIPAVHQKAAVASIADSCRRLSDQVRAKKSGDSHGASE